MIQKIFLASLMTGNLAFAADFPGGGASEEEFSKAFSAEKGVLDKEKASLDADRLKIGGSLQAEWLVMPLANTATQKDASTNPNTLELYFDSQLKGDLRFFARGRLIHDPSIDESVVNPFTGATQRQNTSSLDELKFSFHASRKVFFTLGRQKIKWGAARFWNPTDFLNSARRDFLKADDQRAGISLIKAHVPIGDSNFYLIGVNDRAYETSRTGAAARFEIPFKAGEWTVSGFSQYGRAARLGSDLSFALWDFDLFVEGAQTDYGKEKSASGGISYGFKYNDKDSITLALETYWQELGATNKSAYNALITANQWVPFYVASSYAAFSAYLMSPGSWTGSTFSVSAIQNNVDSSQYYRLSWIYTGMRDISWTLASGTRVGAADSEFRMFGLSQDYSLLAKINF